MATDLKGTPPATATVLKAGLREETVSKAGRARAEEEKMDLGRLEEVFKALADRTRLRILALLATGEVCVCEIHETLQLPQPTVSRHLAYLRNTGLVTGRKDGLWVHYSLANPDDQVVKAILEAAAHWARHAGLIARDAARLEKRTGTPARTGTVLKVLGCCGK